MLEKLDRTDKALLRLIQDKSDYTTKELAAKLNLSPTPVYERIKKLEKSEIIVKRVALLDEKKLGFGLTAFCNIQLKEHSKVFLEEFEHNIQEIPEVTSVYHIAGMSDYLLKVVIKDMQEYQNFVINKLATLKNIGNVQSSFVMTEVKKSTKLPI